MPRRCTVCDYSEMHSIDEALVTGAPTLPMPSQAPQPSHPASL
jgi:hypothetical protein